MSYADDQGTRPSPSVSGGCCFLLILLAVLLLLRVGYVRISDRRAVAAAKSQCTLEQVLHVRQQDVWRQYLSQLPPTEPFGNYILEKRRVQSTMGLRTEGFRGKDKHGYTLSNARGEVARITYIYATSKAFSYDAPPFLIFSCADRFPNLYRKYVVAF